MTLSPLGEGRVSRSDGKRPEWGVPSRLLSVLAFLLALVVSLPALAQTFPELTGRVVDQAGILRPEDKLTLEQRLKAYEERTSDQVVVATIRSLEGYSVEDYANRLYRAWKLGTKEKNNGVLLLVAPSDKKVRIEVGYGLEGALTDALSGIIIRSAIAPKFKTGDFAGGINVGVDGILAILARDAEEWQRKGREPRADTVTGFDGFTIFWIFFIIALVIQAFAREGGGVSHSHRDSQGGWSGSDWSSSGSSGSGGSFGGSGGGSSGGGDFSGGGGSSGGGGASGSW